MAGPYLSIQTGVFTNLWHATKNENGVQGLPCHLSKPRFALLFTKEENNGSL
jgi:hypothetical protein